MSFVSVLDVVKDFDDEKGNQEDCRMVILFAVVMPMEVLGRREKCQPLEESWTVSASE